MKFEEIESKSQEGELSTETLGDLVIKFENVSFKYPRKDELVLKDINITIHPGEKLSIVGLNGAGKTTFIKLLSRLYQPTSGKITLGGVDINEFDYEEYMELLGVVFQDFKLLSYTIKDNLKNPNIEDQGIESSLIRAGFEKDLNVLEKGIDTCVQKHFDNTGIEFSGGQLQKIALARTLHKNPPIVILDEPTSALDPISEYEVYRNFNSMVDGKTAIYISHRLSSTRFSDKIAVFNQGEIVEYGSHNELIEQEELYSEMYHTQSKYYI
jgi:ATP-binding cassette subfamily B protein/ATP-binding cassette subfamily C protein